MRAKSYRALPFALVLTLGCGGAEQSASPDNPEPGTASTSAGQEPEIDRATAREAQTYSLRGRVGDPWGDPVPGATVRVVEHGAGKDADAVAEAICGEDGGYEVELPGPGPWTLYGRHPEVGAHSLDTATITPGAPNKARDLRLIGEGRIAGRLLDAAGAPLAEMKMIGFSRSLLHQELFNSSEHFDLDALPLFAPMLESAFYRRGEGFNHVQTTTDGDGSFLFEGLAPGEYLFYSEAIGPMPWLDPDRRWYETGTLDLELVSPLCSLEISVGDDGVSPVPEDESQRRRLGPLLVFPSVPSAHGGAAILSRGMEVHGGERNVFWVSPGRYVVRATTYPPRGQWGVTLHVEGKLTIEPGEALRRFKLEFPAQDRPTGRLRVSVSVPDGFDAPKKFHLLTVETGQKVECSEYSAYPEPLYGEWLDIPQGEYLVALLPFEDYTGRSEVIDMARVYRRVVIKAGQDTECAIESSFGGGFRLRLGAERFVLGEDLVRPEAFLDGNWRTLLRRLSQRTGSTIALQRADGGSALELRLRDTREYLGKLRDRMLAGEVFENVEVVEPGDYTLWVLCDGFATCSVPVTIRSRETTEVTARLELE